MKSHPLIGRDSAQDNSPSPLPPFDIMAHSPPQNESLSDERRDFRRNFWMKKGVRKAINEGQDEEKRDGEGNERPFRPPVPPELRHEAN